MTARCFARWILILAVATCGVPIAASGGRSDADGGFDAIDAFVRTQMAARRVPGLALAVIQGDRVVHVQHFGQASPTAPVAETTRFRIGSNTKGMTALAIMQLVERGALDLQAPVRLYLPWFAVADPVASTQITIAELLHHTSGIPGLADLDSFLRPTMTLEENVRRLGTVRLDRPVGASYEYANFNYDILGLVVEQVSHESYADYLRAHILRPLGMSHTSVAPDDGDESLAHGYKYWFGFPRPAPDPYSAANLPAGYVSTTAGDLSHYLIAQMNEGRYAGQSILSPAGVARMHEPGEHARMPGPDWLDASYGMGWVTGTAHGRPFFNHGGATLASGSEQIVDVGARVGVIVLTNLQDQFSLDEHVRRIAAGVLLRAGGMDLPPSPPLVPGGYRTINAVAGAVTALILYGLARLLWTRGGGRRRSWSMTRATAEILLGLALVVAPPALVGAPWRVMILEAPDISYWVFAIGAILVFTGLVRAGALAARRAPRSLTRVA